MSFFDKKMKQAQDDTERLIHEYVKLVEGSAEAGSVKQMARKGAPASSVGERAADVHKTLFAGLLGQPARTRLLKSRSRAKIVEHFCVALWRKWLGDGAYEAMTKSLNLSQTPPGL